jgi:hypothetical protein
MTAKIFGRVLLLEASKISAALREMDECRPPVGLQHKDQPRDSGEAEPDL